VLVADAAVAGDELEPELRQIAGLDLADPARHEVIVEQVQLSRAILDSLT